MEHVFFALAGVSAGLAFRFFLAHFCELEAERLVDELALEVVRESEKETVQL